MRQRLNADSAQALAERHSESNCSLGVGLDNCSEPNRGFEHPVDRYSAPNSGLRVNWVSRATITCRADPRIWLMSGEGTSVTTRCRGC